MKQGDFVRTLYGDGKILQYRADEDGVYVVELLYATAYLQPNAVRPLLSKPKKTPMELNVAYEALEKMRLLNLEVQCQGLGLQCDTEACTQCLLRGLHAERLQVAEQRSSNLQNFPRLQSLHSFGRDLRQSRVKARNKSCLICANPTCKEHSSDVFLKEKITLCADCERLFSPQYVIDCLVAGSSQERQQLIDHMIDRYDRSRLLLLYCKTYAEQVAASLEAMKMKANKVGVGSSSVGIVSGVLGVAAAATILTPAGPPLLIASLVFGGSATAAQTGVEVHNYFSEPNQLADRMIALHGILLSILRITGTLRDALLRDYVRGDHYFERQGSNDSLESLYCNNKTKVLGALTVGRYSAAGLEVGRLLTATEVGVTAGRASRFFSRSGTSIMRSLRFARFAGGALSAATLLLEANAMKSTLEEIRDGNPCHKAQTIRRIASALEELPTTEALDEEIEGYLAALALRRRRMTQEEAVKLLLEQASGEEEEEPDTLILDSNQGETDDEPEIAVPPVSESTAEANMSASLIERISLYKKKEQRESMDAS